MKQKLQTMENEKRDTISKLMKDSSINLMNQKESEMKLKIKEDEIEQLKNNLSILQEDLIRSRNAAGLGAPMVSTDFEELESEPLPPTRRSGAGAGDYSSPDNSFNLRPPTPPSASTSFSTDPQQQLMANMMNMANMQSMMMMQQQQQMQEAMRNHAPSMPNMAAFMNPVPSPFNQNLRPNSVGMAPQYGMPNQQNMGMAPMGNMQPNGQPGGINQTFRQHQPNNHINFQSQPTANAQGQVLGNLPPQNLASPNSTSGSVVSGNVQAASSQSNVQVVWCIEKIKFFQINIFLLFCIYYFFANIK